MIYVHLESLCSGHCPFLISIAVVSKPKMLDYLTRRSCGDPTCIRMKQVSHAQLQNLRVKGVSTCYPSKGSKVLAIPIFSLLFFPSTVPMQPQATGHC